MLFSKYIAASALVYGTSAKIIPINVGKAGLTFSPNITTAQEGDVLEFSFFAANHTVTLGSFTTPCQVGEGVGNVFSGFVPTTSESSQTFSVAVNSSTTPLWFFCSQATHCEQGMSMVVNQPDASTNKTLAVYQANSLKQKSDIPAHAAGGNLTGTSASSTASGSASSTSTNTASTSSSTSAAGNVAVSPLNMVAAGAAAIGAFAFSIAL